MKLPRALPILCAGLGGLALIAGAGLFLYMRVKPPGGMEDLGLVVGAMLLAEAGGVLLALSLILARHSPGALSRPVITFAALVSALALLPAFAFAQSAFTSSQLGLLIVTSLAALVCVAGLLSAPRAWRQAG